MNDHDVLIQIQRDTVYLRASVDRLHGKIEGHEVRLRAVEQNGIRTKQILKTIIGIGSFLAVATTTLIVLIV